MVRKQLLDATDAEIEVAVAHADAILLRGLLYLINGDEEAAAIPQSTSNADFRGLLPTIVDTEHVTLLRRKTVAFLKSYRDGGIPPLPIETSRLNRAMDLALGVQIPEDERPMWIEQMGLEPLARSFQWDTAYPEPTEEQKQRFRVVVIGAGMGGLNSAMQLDKAGIPFVVIEKNSGVGGTWHENRYPGARVDTPSRNYFHTFATEYPCSGAYCAQAANRSYFEWVADKFELRKNITFSTEVTSVVWDEDAHIYHITAEGPDGQRCWRANAVISCVGFLNRPKLPNIPGAASYQGQIIHTARWPGTLDLAGKRVAVIGSGATSYQMVPEMLKTIGDKGHLTLFQRTPSWCFEMPGYLQPFSPEVMWLDRNLPFMANFSRLQVSWVVSPAVLLRLIEIDHNYHDPHARSEINKLTRDAAIATMTRMLPGRPDLVEKMTPEAPPFSSRPILMDSDNNIYSALMQDNVELVRDGIKSITPNGIITLEGTERPFDIIVYATGFKANEFLWPIDLRGRGGKSIGELWRKDGARAYLGTMVPGFPNFFMIYGPNMNPFLNGLGVVEMEELSTRFALRCIGTLIRQNRHSIEVEESAYSRFNEELDRLEANKIYADPRVTNYYKNDFGRSAVNCPFDIRLLWKWWHDPADAQGISKISDPLIRPYIGQDLKVE